MTQMLKSELFRMRKRPQTWILAILMIFSAAAFYVALTIASFVISDPAPAQDSLLLSRLFDNGMQIVTFVGSILTVVMAAGLIGNEYGWNTIRPLLARSASRRALLSAKWLTVLLSSVGIFVVGLMASVIFSAVGSGIAGVFQGVDAKLVGDWTVSFGRLLASQLPYAFLAFVVALWTRSNAAGIAVGIGMGILEPAVWGLLGLVTNAFDTVQKFGIEHPSALLYNMNFSNQQVASGDAWRALAVLCGWTAIMVVSSYWVFDRRDVTSG